MNYLPKELYDYLAQPDPLTTTLRILHGYRRLPIGEAERREPIRVPGFRLTQLGFASRREYWSHAYSFLSRPGDEEMMTVEHQLGSLWILAWMIGAMADLKHLTPSDVIMASACGNLRAFRMAHGDELTRYKLSLEEIYVYALDLNFVKRLEVLTGSPARKRPYGLVVVPARLTWKVYVYMGGLEIPWRDRIAEYQKLFEVARSSGNYEFAEHMQTYVRLLTECTP